MGKFITFQLLENASPAAEFFGNNWTSQDSKYLNLRPHLVLMVHVTFVENGGSQANLVVLAHSTSFRGLNTGEEPGEPHTLLLQVLHAQLDQRLW